MVRGHVAISPLTLAEQVGVGFRPFDRQYIAQVGVQSSSVGCRSSRCSAAGFASTTGETEPCMFRHYHWRNMHVSPPLYLKAFVGTCLVHF